MSRPAFSTADPHIAGLQSRESHKRPSQQTYDDQVSNEAAVNRRAFAGGGRVCVSYLPRWVVTLLGWAVVAFTFVAPFTGTSAAGTADATHSRRGAWDASYGPPPIRIRQR